MPEGGASAAALAARCRKFRRERLIVSPNLLRLGAGEADHFGPFLGFFDDKLAELCRRARKRCAPQIGEPRLDGGIGERRVRSLPARMNSIDGGSGPNITCTCPLIRSVSAGDAPRYGT